MREALHYYNYSLPFFKKMKKSKINIDGVPGQDLFFLSLKCLFLLLLVFALHLPQEILEAIRNHKT